MPCSSHQRFHIFSTTTRESIRVPSMSKSSARASMTVPCSSRMLPPVGERCSPYRSGPGPSARRLRLMVAYGLGQDRAHFGAGAPCRLGLATTPLGLHRALRRTLAADVRHLPGDLRLLFRQRGMARGVRATVVGHTRIGFPDSEFGLAFADLCHLRTELRLALVEPGLLFGNHGSAVG